MTVPAVVVVAVVLNGALLPTISPARLAGGQVFAPLDPIVDRIASRSELAPSGQDVLLERAGRRVTVPVAWTAGGTAYVALAPVVRALGGRARYDGRSHTLLVDVPDDGPIRTPAPFTGGSAAPVRLFAPGVAPVVTPAPGGPATGAPAPRRTPIPAVPSQPVVDPG